MTQTVDSPALTASQSSWRCSRAHDREGWLALMADDVVIEDPIGKSVTNPDGTGVRGKEAVGAFFDSNIAPIGLTITCEETFPSSSPDEIAHILLLHFRLGRVHQHRAWGVHLQGQRRGADHQHARILEPRRDEIRQGRMMVALKARN